MASAALQKIMDLEKEVTKLRHHVSVLSKRNHALKQEVEKKKEEEACEQVTSPVRGKEPEPRGVAETSDQVMGKSGHIVVQEEEDVLWMVPVVTPRVGTPPVAESRVAIEMDDGPLVVVMLGSKKRRVEESGEEESSGGEEEGVEEVGPVVPVGPRGGMPMGPAMMVGGRRVPNRHRGRPGFRYEEVNRYRFVDRTLLGQRSGIVGDSYHTRGDRARALGRGNMRGGRGFFFSYH